MTGSFLRGAANDQRRSYSDAHVREPKSNLPDGAGFRIASAPSIARAQSCARYLL